ncbi:MAG: hypothetical protein H5U02_00055 [Clostridia bacterium]|nr:hypothetical protein [Clostridia bacterium]
MSIPVKVALERVREHVDAAHVLLKDLVCREFPDCVPCPVEELWIKKMHDGMRNEYA